MENRQGKFLIPEKVASELFIEQREETPFFDKLITAKRIKIVKARDAN